MKSVSDAKVAVFAQGVDTTGTETKGTVLIKSAEQLESYSRCISLGGGADVCMCPCHVCMCVCIVGGGTESYILGDEEEKAGGALSVWLCREGKARTH